jgi:hypothetical protein
LYKLATQHLAYLDLRKPQTKSSTDLTQHAKPMLMTRARAPGLGW